MAFYVDSVNQLPLVQQQFGSALLGHRIIGHHRVATGLTSGIQRTKGRNDHSADL